MFSFVAIMIQMID